MGKHVEVHRINGMNSSQLLEQLDRFTTFVGSLRELSNEIWTASIDEGKWSIRDIISHIMMWDRNFLDKIIPKLLEKESVTLEEDMDVPGFNARAVEFGKTLTQEQLIEKTVFYRSEIISQLSKLPETAFTASFPGHNAYTLASFLQNLFISHDLHHQKQIEEFTARNHL